MEFSQIKYFIMAAQMQNISKAAQILNITQSALSKSISNLEDELGVLLFDRSGKKVTLNNNGKNFLEHAIQSVQELDSAVSAARKQDVPPTLNLGLFHRSEKFMQCVNAFLELNTNIAIQLDRLELTSFGIGTNFNINTNEYDMLIFPRIPLFHRYKADVIYSDSYYLAVNKSNPLSEKTIVKLSDLSAQNLIFIKYGINLFDLPYHLYINLETGISEYIFTNSYEIQRWLISNNYGIGFVPQSCSGSYSLDPNIELLPVWEEGLRKEIMVGFKREKYLSNIASKFSGFVRSYFGI